VWCLTTTLLPVVAHEPPVSHAADSDVKMTITDDVGGAITSTPFYSPLFSDVTDGADPYAADDAAFTGFDGIAMDDGEDGGGGCDDGAADERPSGDNSSAPALEDSMVRIVFCRNLQNPRKEFIALHHSD
jgi:hypothetical protein